MTTKNGFDALMDEVCVGLGFCGEVVDGKPLHVTDFIPDEGRVSADQFVEWVFRAEGFDPVADYELCQKHKDAIRSAFVTHMAGETANAQALRWPLNPER